jgi:DNA-directed RNA polymerase specialized sigma subunit
MVVKDFFPQFATSATFRKKLVTIIEQMEQGSEEEQIYSSILKLAYIQKSLKHEGIADRLNLSLSTYYRYIKKAIEKTAYYLMKDNRKGL